MDKFIKFLIYTLKTIDGNTGSSEAILNEKLKIESQRLKYLLCAKKLDREQEYKIKQINEMYMCNKIF